MADTNKDIWNDADEETPKKKHPVRRFFLFFRENLFTYSIVSVKLYAVY